MSLSKVDARLATPPVANPQEAPKVDAKKDQVVAKVAERALAPRQLTPKQEAAALEKEIQLLQKQDVPRKWKWFGAKDSNMEKEQQHLIMKLAEKLVVVLRTCLNLDYAEKKNRPFSAQEEMVFAGQAKRLVNAYKLAGITDRATEAQQRKLAAKAKAASDKAQVLQKQKSDIEAVVIMKNAALNALHRKIDGGELTPAELKAFDEQREEIDREAAEGLARSEQSYNELVQIDRVHYGLAPIPAIRMQELNQDKEACDKIVIDHKNDAYKNLNAEIFERLCRGPNPQSLAPAQKRIYERDLTDLDVKARKEIAEIQSKAKADIEKIEKKAKSAITAFEQKEIDQVIQANDEVKQAVERADKIVKQSNYVKSLQGKLRIFEEWVKTPRNDNLRWMGNFWTTQGAKLEIAKMKVELAELEAQKTFQYSTNIEKLISALNAVIDQKQQLAAVQTPDSIEYLATTRAIRDHHAEIEKLKGQLEAFENDKKDELSRAILDARWAREDIAKAYISNAKPEEITAAYISYQVALNTLIRKQQVALELLELNSTDYTAKAKEINELKGQLKELDLYLQRERDKQIL